MPEIHTVVHVLSRLAPGGVEIWLLRLLPRFDPARFRFTICTAGDTPGPLNDQFRSAGVDVVACPLRAGILRFTRDFRELLHRQNAQVVHSHAMFASGFFLWLARRAGVPVRLAHAHSAADNRAPDLRRVIYRRLMRRAIWRYATQGIACSSEAADCLFSPRWRGRPNYHILPCGIDTRCFEQPASRAALCAQLGVPADRRIVGHVGRFDPAKNHALTIRFIRAAKEQGLNMHLVLVGDGPTRPAAQALAAELDCADRVTFAGARSDVPALMRGLFDLLILPSWFEGLPVVAIEAQCAGLPCLLSDAVTRETAVVPEIVHWHSPHAPPESWVRQAQEILARPRADPTATLEAVRRSAFTIEANVRLLSSLYLGPRVVSGG